MREIEPEGGCEPISERLLGRVSQWNPTGCIAHTIDSGIQLEGLMCEADG